MLLESISNSPSLQSHPITHLANFLSHVFQISISILLSSALSSSLTAKIAEDCELS
ncbi:unnamed protein product [Trifolium pratense]|uniref:Uncharacterized protein n=1 Tax=Trifolium pratense TaxID=57577 RepID=A0ACB0LUF1_TRIPR|nr:unnamed protein product [Trifolium pratense]